MNIIHASGRLVKDPEIRYTKNNVAVATFTIATNEGKDKDGKPITEFIRCRSFKKTAELIDQYFVKGSPIIVHGKWHGYEYEKDGRKVYATECVVNQIEFQLGKAVNGRDIEPSNDDFQEVEGGELPF